MSLADYLAKNYLSDKKKGKKKKEKKVENRSNNDTFLKPAKTLPIALAEPERLMGWKVVGTDQIVNGPPGPTMTSGAKAGLQTGAQAAEQIRAKQQRELEMLQSTSAYGLGRDAETVYRDTSGARVDMRSRLEDRKRKREEEETERERKKKEINMGLVQRLELEERRKRLIKATELGLSRYSDDKELNDRLKSKDHEDDPMLSFKPSKSKKYVSVTGRKLYKGTYPENRFQITPGHRWDGVDRSNGFEKAHFQKQLEVERNKTLSYTMQED
jgi:pre-mRNA-splicing factor CWC26